jgi:hypothetical protein
MRVLCNLNTPGHLRLFDSALDELDIHGVPAEKVAVTGAQPFDPWFGRAPSASREEFCTRVGVHPDRPLVLSCASRSNIAEGVEQRFVDRWIATICARESPTVASVRAPASSRRPSRYGASGS